MKYTNIEKMEGKDLYGLPCRVPEPTPAQAECSHSRFEYRDMGFRDDWTGEWVEDFKSIEVDCTEDIPGTNNFRCTLCGYTRRY